MKNKNWIEEDSKKIQIRDEMYLKNLKNLKGDRSIITKNTFRESSDKYPKFIVKNYVNRKQNQIKQTS